MYYTSIFYISYVDPTDDFDEEQYNIQSLSLDLVTNILYLGLLVIWILHIT